MERIELKAEDRSFEALLADNIVSHFLGMRFRKSGKMLFKFYKESMPGIDMMFVPGSLHLYFLNSDREVVDVQRAEAWTLNPRTWRFYRPSQKSKYLLESSEPLDIEEGDRLEFE